MSLVVAVIAVIIASNLELNDVAQNAQISTATSPFSSVTSTVLSATTTDGFTYITVKRVVDGDTIELENGEKVRYIGVNSPESVDPRRAVQCFGKEASRFNKELIEGKRVRLEKDISNKDKYGRLLRFVYLEDGTFVNLKLVADGYARVYTYPPDVSHSEEFRAAEKEARDEKRGLWSACL